MFPLLLIAVPVLLVGGLMSAARAAVLKRQAAEEQKTLAQVAAGQVPQRYLNLPLVRDGA